jgi:hypothetical protein
MKDIDMAGEEATHKVISRKEAKGKGLKYYRTGKLCKRGHLDQRRVATCMCRACEVVIQREWKGNNKEWVRKRDLAQRDKDRDKVRAQERARYAQNPQKHIEKSQRYYWKNPELARAKSNRWYHVSYTKPEVRQRAQDRTRQWAKDNPEKARANAQVSKARRRGIGAEGLHTGDDIKRIMKDQKGRCAYCRKKVGKEYHIDHIIPLAKGGTNFARNIQITCAKCNMEKHARDPIDHARKIGMLL